MINDVFHLWIRSVLIVSLVTSLGWLPAQIDGGPDDLQSSSFTSQESSTSEKTAELDPAGNT